MEVVKNMFSYLNKNTNYAVLRNEQGLPNFLVSRDIDIIIERQEFFRKLDLIVEVIIESGFKILTKFENDRIYTLVCATTNNKLDIIQFDFFFQTSIFGFNLLSAKEILETKLFNGKVYHAAPFNQYLDKNLYLKFLGFINPKKYAALRDLLINDSDLKQILKNKFGCDSLEDFENLSVSTYRKKILTYNFTKGFTKQIKSTLLFIWFYIKNSLSYKGFSIGFTGPDGAGKTTVINMVIAELEKVYSSIDLHHFRPTIIPNLGEAAQKAKLKDKVDTDYSNPHRGEKTSKLNSFFRLSYYTLDYILGYFKTVRPKLVQRSIVIFDRYYTDIIADSRRSRIYLNPKFLFVFGRFFVPKLDYNILLTADSDTILKRKQELTAEGIIQINNKIDYLKNKKDYYKIENNGSAEEAVCKILSLVIDSRHKKILED